MELNFRSARGHYHVAPDRSWELLRVPPEPRLKGLVTGYVGYVERSAGLLRRLQVPSAGAKLILAFGEPMSVSTLDGRSSQMRGGFFVRFSELPAITEFRGECRGIEIGLTPLGAWRLFGPAVTEHDDPVVDLAALTGPGASAPSRAGVISRPGGAAGPDICERLAELSDWDSRFDLVDRFIESRLAAREGPPPMLEWTWQRLVATGGTVRVSELACHMGLSHGYLSRSFRRHFGLTPKAAAAILRFNELERQLRLTPDDEVSLAQMALDCGYHDQSHMTHEFRRFTGTTPAVYLRAHTPEFLGHPA